MISAARRIVPSPPMTTASSQSAAGVGARVGDSTPRVAVALEAEVARLLGAAAGPRARGRVQGLARTRARPSRASVPPGVGEQQHAAGGASLGVGHGSTFSPGTDGRCRTDAPPRRSSSGRRAAAGPRRSHRKNSTLPGRARQRAGVTAGRPSPRAGGRVGDGRDRLGPQLRVADDAALADPVLADLELRLHHQRQVAVRARSRRAGRPAPASSEMNDRSPTTRSTGSADQLGGQVADVGPVVHHDPVVAAAAARPAGRSPTSTATTSRAPARSSTSVNPPVDAPASRQRRPSTTQPGGAERRQRTGQLVPAARDVVGPVRVLGHHDRDVGRDPGRRLGRAGRRRPSPGPRRSARRRAHASGPARGGPARRPAGGGAVARGRDPSVRRGRRARGAAARGRPRRPPSAPRRRSRPAPRRDSSTASTSAHAGADGLRPSARVANDCASVMGARLPRRARRSGGTRPSVSAGVAVLVEVLPTPPRPRPATSRRARRRP